MIITNINQLRDPFLLMANGAYYMYGTGVGPGNDWDNTNWICFKNDSGRLDGDWRRIEGDICVAPEFATKNRWAPEVHEYKGNYYMFTTYFSTKTNHRGCTVFKSASPEGPFVEISDGHITPAEWDAIDGTLYIDAEGQPWMVFVREWTATDDGVGRMVVSKLSDDLTKLISEPVELFRADDPSWTNHIVTDGCFLYENNEGELLMIWSNFEPNGYCVGIAKSENGKIDGKWIQQDELLFSKALSGDYDGGHGMIFTDTDGTKYICLHSPNNPQGERCEKPILIPIKEQNGTLVCEL